MLERRVLEQRRQHVQWSIQQNPTTITIMRTEKIPSGGGFAASNSQHGPYQVRVFQKSSVTPDNVAQLAGRKQTDESWGLLTDFEADIKAGPNVKDEFETGLGKFAVMAVYPQMLAGQITSYQADLKLAK